jgi:hypothetical protein
MRPVRLRIDRLVLELAEAGRAREVEPLLRAALTILARRLAEAPGPLVRDVAIDGLRILAREPLPAGQLATGGFTERLADDLYAAIVHRRPRAASGTAP